MVGIMCNELTDQDNAFMYSQNTECLKNNKPKTTSKKGCLKY